MTHAVFVRGVNVGGHNVFRPKALADALSRLDVVNIGAAGTFVVRKAIAASALREEIRRRLPDGAEVMICPGRDVLDLISREGEESSPGARRYLCVLGARPKKPPPLPLRAPAGSAWQVEVGRIDGVFVTGLWRPVTGKLLYPNQVVEKELGVAATTRTWDTILKVAALLRGDGE